MTADTLNYPNWQGNPSPSLLKWFPAAAQRHVHRAGPSGLERDRQRQLRHHRRGVPHGRWDSAAGSGPLCHQSIAPNDQGPVFDQSKFNPTLTSYANGTVRVAWQANWDRDNEQLTYQVIRNGDIANPVYETTWLSSEWNRPDMGFLDTGLVPGTSYTLPGLRQRPVGNEVRSDTVTVVASGTGDISALREPRAERRRGQLLAPR